jgi:hypothetical protein
MEKPGQERDIKDHNDFTRVRENWKIPFCFFICKNTDLLLYYCSSNTISLQ